MTLSEYVKSRRLSQANQDLLMGEKVTDIAYKYGYGSMDGFARAFKKWSGFLPSDAVKKRISKPFPKLSFVITIKGGNTMECRIEEKPAFYLAGVSKRVPMQFEGVNNAIVDLAMSITNEQREEMHALQNMEPHQIVNASYEADAGFLKEEGELTHLIGVLTTKEEVSDRLVKVPVEACVWAVFPNEGPFPFTLQIPWRESIPNGCPLPIMKSLTCLLFPFQKWMSIKRITLTAKFGHRFGRKNEFICVSSAFATENVKRRGNILAVLLLCSIDTLYWRILLYITKEKGANHRLTPFSKTPMQSNSKSIARIFWNTWDIFIRPPPERVTPAEQKFMYMPQ